MMCLDCRFGCDSTIKVIANKKGVTHLLTVNLAPIHVLNTYCFHFQIVKDNPTKLESFCVSQFSIVGTVSTRTSSGVLVPAYHFRG